MAWTTISKPGPATYTNLNSQGREQYDQATLSYDDSSTFYDGINQDQWTMLAKPTGGSNFTATIQVGMVTGLIMPPTYSTEHVIQVNSDIWTKIPKPN